MIKVSVIIPAYNEQATILQVLELVARQKVAGIEFEVIVIDDGSKDRTLELLRSRPDLYSKVIACEKNGGKGAAVKAGLLQASGDYILFQDADLEYDPAEYSNLLMPILKFDADIIMGSRFLAPRYTRVHYFFNKIGNKLITFTFNILFNKTFTDIYTCYFVYRRKLVDPTTLRYMDFDQQAEILAKAIRDGKNCYEVPISYHGRTYEEGKKIRAHHALLVIRTIIRERLFSR